MLSGNLPFYGENINAVYKSIVSGSFSLEGEIWNNISIEAKDLVKRLLCLDPNLRLSAKETLQHP